MPTSPAPASVSRQHSPRRILIVGRADEYRTESSLARAARRLGHASLVLDATSRRRWLGPLATTLLLRRADRFAADTVILTRHAGVLEERVLDRLTRGRRVLTWYLDFHAAVESKVVRAARASDILYVTCPTMRQAYVRQGIGDVRWLPMALDPEMDFPEETAPAAYACDVSFVGSGQFPDRNALLRRIASAARLQIRGASWRDAKDLPVAGGPARGKAFRHAVRGASISLGAYATGAQAVAPACISNRVWKVLGCGGFFLGAASPGIGVLYDEGRHTAAFGSDDEAVEQVRHWLAHPVERAAIAASGRAHALAHHTYEHRLRAMLGETESPVPPDLP